MWQSAMPPPEPRLSTRRVGVFVTLLNKEASMERTAPAKPQRGGGGERRGGGLGLGFWPGFARGR